MKSVLACALLVACGHGEEVTRGAVEPEAPDGAKLVVTSTAFAPGGTIPVDFTCEGTNIAPDLTWSGAPPATKSFAIIVDDPDAPDPAAPKQTWVHWVLIDIPATITNLPPGAGATPPDGAANGTNDFKKTAWGGPCPPTGTHRYFFKVFALDLTIGKAGITKPELLAAIRGHVVARGELIGRYKKQRGK